MSDESKKHIAVLFAALIGVVIFYAFHKKHPSIRTSEQLTDNTDYPAAANFVPPNPTGDTTYLTYNFPKSRFPQLPAREPAGGCCGCDGTTLLFSDIDVPDDVMSAQVANINSFSGDSALAPTQPPPASFTGPWGSN